MRTTRESTFMGRKRSDLDQLRHLASNCVLTDNLQYNVASLGQSLRKFSWNMTPRTENTVYVLIT